MVIKMRVTQSMMTRNYLKNLNSSMTNVASSNSKISSGRKYTRMSQNVSEGARALKVHEDIYKNEQYLANIKDAEVELSSAESNLKSITEILQTAQERITKGLNGTISEADRKTIANDIRSLQDQVLKTANAKFGDKFLFSGTNNATPPFTMNDAGEVLYNGYKMNDIYQKSDGIFYIDDPANPGNEIVVPNNKKMYIDIGLGIKTSGSAVDPTTAFETSFSGLGVIGFGKSKDGLPNNVIELLGTMANALSPATGSYNQEEAEKCMMLLKDQTDFVVSNMTDIGTRCNFLEKTAERIESDSFNLESLRSKLEDTDDATETMNAKMFEYAWMATLKIGSKVIPVSLMDFIS